MKDNSSILILTNSLGGLFSFRKEVVKALIDDGFDVSIACPPQTSKKGDYFKEIGCSVIDISMERRGTNPLNDFSLFKQYRKIMRNLKPVAVLTYTVKPNVYGGLAARWSHIPQLANITGLGDAIENPGLLQKFTVFMYGFGLKKAQKVFYQNVSIQEFCQKHKIGKQGQLLPGSGVNLEWHTFKEYPAQDQIMKFNFIGRVMKDKGVEEYFEMAKTIRQKYPNTEFHILGRCEEKYEGLLKQLQDEGTIIWHGSVPDVRPYIKDSFATIHPSYHEGMANVLLETCAGGRPVIACDINGCKEAIDEGVNGFICKVKDVKDLTEKVERFINLPYDKKVEMGLAARKKVEREFDRNLVIAAYMDEIKKINK